MTGSGFFSWALVTPTWCSSDGWLGDGMTLFYSTIPFPSTPQPICPCDQSRRMKKPPSRTFVTRGENSVILNYARLQGAIHLRDCMEALVEFKSPSDTLRAGDFQTFLSYALLYRAQNDALLALDRLHLLVLAPRLTKPYREELRVLGAIAQQQGAGVRCLQGGLVIHPTWVLETEELAG